MTELTAKIEEYIRKERAVFISDITRKFGIHFMTAHDIVKHLEEQGKIEIRDKGIAKLILPKK